MFYAVLKWTFYSEINFSFLFFMVLVARTSELGPNERHLFEELGAKQNDGRGRPRSNDPSCTRMF